MNLTGKHCVALPNYPHSIKTINYKKDNSPCNLSMKGGEAHILFSDWKQKPGSHCTCWAKAFWSFPQLLTVHLSRETAATQTSVVQQPP